LTHGPGPKDSNMTNPLLDIVDLSVHFRTEQGAVHALRKLHLTLERGEIVGLVGETGCGKSVSGLSILRMVPPPGRIVGGRVLFHGENLLAKSDAEMRQIRGRYISMIFQDPSSSLNPVLSIQQQMSAVLRQHLKISRGAARDRMLQLLADVGLPNPGQTARCYPHQLSGGMQQRVMIAMALSTDPEILIADEPTTALDVTIQAQILELLSSLKQRREITILLITHNLGIVAETCQRVVVLYAGQVVEQAPVLDLFQRPSHPYTRGLLAALPRPGAQDQSLRVIPGRVPSGMDILTGCAFAPRCSMAAAQCTTENPPMVRISDQHHVACYFANEGDRG
jgi:oligopeptide/dipeptide ABC transporter ATP-binding protein